MDGEVNMKRLAALFAILLFIMYIPGCNKKANTEKGGSNVMNNTAAPQKVEEKDTEADASKKDVNYKEIKANESGKVMVLMYHGIGPEESEWVRSISNFKKDLAVLYENGYRTISLHDYINNSITTPAGLTPVVITFDDGLQNQFNMVEKDGREQIDPDCAVSIMQEFAKSHPGFGNYATFYVYYPIPFRQRDKIKEKLEYLISNGFDVGNHTYSHEMLGKMDKDGIQKQLGLNVKSTSAYLPDYTVDTMALPYGSRPKDETLRKCLTSGNYDGIAYNNRAVLLVGSNPAPAPASFKYDPSAIPRIRASETNTGGTGLYDWLKYFDIHPEQRYISDGDPNTVAVPMQLQDNINIDGLKDIKLITY
jgi:Predicted xylanase/chitin deacetylase